MEWRNVHQNPMLVYHLVIRTSYSVPETPGYGQKFGGAGWLTHVRCKIPMALKAISCDVLDVSEGAAGAAAFVETRSPALLGLRYLVCFQTKPGTLILSFWLGGHTQGTTSVKFWLRCGSI